MLKIKFINIRLFIFTLIVFLLLTSVGCVNTANEDNNIMYNDMYFKAMAILDEFSEDQRIIDFRNAYDLLMTLPSNENRFIAQLRKVNQIYEKYGVELEYGDYYLVPNKNYISINKEEIDKYRTKSAYYDACDLLSAIVYPVLFEKYGSEAQCIKGVTAGNIRSAIKSTKDYTLDKITEQYDGYEEKWKYIGNPKTEYSITYHKNGMVKSLDIPIAKSNNPLNDNEFIAFLNKDDVTQKQLAGTRFTSMAKQISVNLEEYNVLSQIFNDKEISIISNYIQSLTAEEIWKRNIYAASGNLTDYYTSIVMFDYKGNQMIIRYNLNYIHLSITGKNHINPLSHRWYTLFSYLCYPNSLEDYRDYIDNNTEYNSVIQDYSFNLDANADKFATDSMNGDEHTPSNENNTNTDVQQYLPVELSMAEQITVYGVIEANDTPFPSYRLKVTPKLLIIFDEYLGEKAFECEYLYFYDDAELNNYFPIQDFVGYSCTLITHLKDYRGGDELFMLKPTFTQIQIQE